ncbi:hypothetical protein GH733_010428 [Mirounga leonina]|nr:hypothetical protein GH733_010428 [Mirounga leonina]
MGPLSHQQGPGPRGAQPSWATDLTAGAVSHEPQETEAECVTFRAACPRATATAERMAMSPCAPDWAKPPGCLHQGL